MACFLVPAGEAIVTTIAAKIIRSGEKDDSGKDGIRFSEKIGWLNGMLWGGSGLLAFEHIWHGEVVPFFPFLTNAADPADRAEMLAEMGTSGVAMAVLVTLVWVAMAVLSDKIIKPAKPVSEGAKS